MKTVTLRISSRAAAKQRMAAAFAGETQGEFISFTTVDLLWKVLSTKRWEILQVMIGQGEMSMREVARRVNRDIKAVHGDVTALLDAGVLERSARGVLFPYDAVHVDFTLKAA
jgi:predicted transcriptional regulator